MTDQHAPTPPLPPTDPGSTAVAEPSADGAVEPKPMSGAPVDNRDPHAAALDAALPLLSAVEAMIITSARPVPSRRLAQALGLMPPDEPAQQDPANPGSIEAAPETEPGTSGDPASSPAPKRRRTPRRASKAAGPEPEAVVAAAVDLLNRAYAESRRAFRIEALAGGYRVMTLPEHGDAVARLQGLAAPARLSRPAIETLAIIAYRQPVTRAHLEAIRGVACGEVVKTLLDRKLITIAGRAEELGRPLLYATTKQFLAAFGLSSIKDLPTPGELGLRAT
ncbi:MAG: SMC-Scp complex subunit ScpB [Phycisphaerae bacterium]|nr:SMC-Scp complex subunit ScpB [Phycisphaerae bacterium]